MLTQSMIWHSALLWLHCGVVLILVLVLAETIGIYSQHRPTYYIHKTVPRWLREIPIFRTKISKYTIFLFFLIVFSTVGYVVQLSVYAATRQFYNVNFVVIFVISLFFTRFMLRCMTQVIRPTTSSCDIDLTGNYAMVTGGTAKPSQAAYAVLRDMYGQQHKVLVKPEYGELAQYHSVLLIKYKQGYYIAVPIQDSSATLENDNSPRSELFR